MLPPEAFHRVAELLGERFLSNPGNYVTESDLQVRLTREIRAALIRHGSGPSIAPRFNVAQDSSYKGPYVEAVERGYRTEGIDPVHTEVSLEKGERIDVGVFGTQDPSVYWENGSKKFDADDFAALFELKFVKNRKKPPTVTGFEPYQERNSNYGPETLREVIDWTSVGVRQDVEALGRREVDYRAVLVFSNFNYYYYRPTRAEVEHAPLYDDLGDAAREVVKTAGAEAAVNILYVAPELPGPGRGGRSCGGITWIQEAV